MSMNGQADVNDSGDDIGAMVVATATGIFESLSPITNVALRESADRGEFDATGWRALQEAGFPLALLPEELGGIGTEHAFAIARLAGAMAIPLPIVETMGANWLLAHAGLDPTDEPLGLSEAVVELRRTDGGWQVSGHLAATPWARSCGLVMAGNDGDSSYIVRLEPGSFAINAGSNIAGEPRDSCTINLTVPDDHVGRLDKSAAPSIIRGMGALLRSAQIAGAISAAVTMTVDYARERRQFGKPLAAFQAVQQLLAVIATQAAAARVAADLGTIGLDTAIDIRRVAVAKSRTSEAAGLVAATAHQLHGAIGFTREFPLQLLTRRLWSWRDEFGSESEWSIALGRDLAPAGSALWSEITRI